MTIQQCKYVLEIAKTRSFSEAAKQHFIAQSSLSISIKTLEQELGIKIFERSGNGVYLTEEGAEFVKYARQICDSNDFVMKRYNSQTAQKKLNIATQHYDFIADVFGVFLSNTEDESYKFTIKEIETYNVIREVETAYSDIGIIAIKDGDYEIMKRYLNKKKLSFTSFLKVSPHVFFRKSHPLSGADKLCIADLREYPYVSYEQGEHNSSFFTEEIMDTSNVNKHVEISDRATLMNVLLITNSYTVGTGIMPSSLNQDAISSVPLEGDEYYIIGYLLNENRKISKATETFIGVLEELVKQYKRE